MVDVRIPELDGLRAKFEDDEYGDAARETGWPILPDAALHGLAGDVVRSIAPHTEADPAAILIQFLTAAANLTGPGPHCMVENTSHRLNLFAILVGESSKARKGTSWNHIQHLCSRVDGEWATNRITGGLSSAEGLLSEVRDGEEPAKDRRLLVMQSEFAGVLRVMARDGSTLSPVLRDAWDSGNLRTLVKHDPLRATGALISMVGHITRDELLRYLSDTEKHNGFANRLLWCSIKRSKCLPEGGHVPSEQLGALARRLQDVVSFGKEFFIIERDDQARRFWAEVYPRLSEGLPGLLGAATSRAEAQVLRLSAIYAILDRRKKIGVDHLNAALAVWRYSFSSARYIFGDATGDPIADRIRAELESREDGMTRTDIRDVFKRHESNERITQALNQLAALGVAKMTLRKTEGRSIEFWTATKAT